METITEEPFYYTEFATPESETVEVALYDEPSLMTAVHLVNGEGFYAFDNQSYDDFRALVDDESPGRYFATKLARSGNGGYHYATAELRPETPEDDFEVIELTDDIDLSDLASVFAALGIGGENIDDSAPGVTEETVYSEAFPGTRLIVDLWIDATPENKEGLADFVQVLMDERLPFFHPTVRVSD